MSEARPANGGASSFQQFERILQQLHDKQGSHALLIADEAMVVTLPTSTATGAGMPLQRLDNILQLLPPERVSARNVAISARYQNLPALMMRPENNSPARLKARPV